MKYVLRIPWPSVHPSCCAQPPDSAEVNEVCQGHGAFAGQLISSFGLLVAKRFTPLGGVRTVKMSLSVAFICCSCPDCCFSCSE